MLTRVLFRNSPPRARDRRRFKPAWIGLAALFAAVVFGSTIAAAVGPSGIPNGNTYTGCRKTTTGAFRLIDKTKKQVCKAGESQVSWTTWKWRGTWSATTSY